MKLSEKQIHYHMKQSFTTVVFTLIQNMYRTNHTL